MSQKDLYKLGVNCFRPQQGLTIMNWKRQRCCRELGYVRFRPQQGLTIMNSHETISVLVKAFEMFPSPTGVNYYE